jgi:hypothetical protein
LAATSDRFPSFRCPNINDLSETQFFEVLNGKYVYKPSVLFSGIYTEIHDIHFIKLGLENIIFVLTAFLMMNDLF